MYRCRAEYVISNYVLFTLHIDVPDVLSTLHTTAPTRMRARRYDWSIRSKYGDSLSLGKTRFGRGKNVGLEANWPPGCGSGGELKPELWKVVGLFSESGIDVTIQLSVFNHRSASISYETEYS